MIFSDFISLRSEICRGTLVFHFREKGNPFYVRKFLCHVKHEHLLSLSVILFTILLFHFMNILVGQHNLEI